MRLTSKFHLPSRTGDQRAFILAWGASLFFLAFSHLSAAFANEQFSDFEIRVIRPRYFSKARSFELATQGLIITNQTFIYTYLLSGILTYHFTEAWGLELSAAMGSSFDKEDKTLLETDFNIKTQIIRTHRMLYGNLLWTPIYGKYQLASGRLIYFDTFLSAGLGSSEVAYRFDHCVVGDGQAFAVRDDYSQPYPSVSVGLGQRFYISKYSSLRWDLRGHTFSYNHQDGACSEDPTAAEISLQHFNLTMGLGYSWFI